MSLWINECKEQGKEALQPHRLRSPRQKPLIVQSNNKVTIERKFKWSQICGLPTLELYFEFSRTHHVTAEWSLCKIVL